MNRWYDKLQIIVCGNGEAGINFEHTGVDGHTVLRYAADVYTELVLLFAKTINPSTPSLFKAKLSPFAKGSKTKSDKDEADEEVDVEPKKLEWRLTPELRAGVRYAETRISDLICQNDSQALEFKGYGSGFIKRHGFSPDAFVQMAFQAAYFGLYGEFLFPALPFPNLDPSSLYFPRRPKQPKDGGKWRQATSWRPSEAAIGADFGRPCGEHLRTGHDQSVPARTD